MSWATGGIERRIRKLEGPKGTDLEQLTDDELEIYLLEINRAIVADESVAQDEREECERHIAEIEADIIRGLRSRPRQNIRLIWSTAAKTGASVRGDTITFRRCFIGMALREIWTSQT
jgi:hypothetical protein